MCGGDARNKEVCLLYCLCTYMLVCTYVCKVRTYSTLYCSTVTGMKSRKGKSVGGAKRRVTNQPLLVWRGGGKGRVLALRQKCVGSHPLNAYSTWCVRRWWWWWWPSFGGGCCLTTPNTDWSVYSRQAHMWGLTPHWKGKQCSHTPVAQFVDSKLRDRIKRIHLDGWLGQETGPKQKMWGRGLQKF